MNKIHIDATRLWHSIMTTAEFGRTDKGGLNRTALTDSDKKVRDTLAEWSKEAGFEYGYDAVGNMFITLPGTQPELAPVMSGSHLDTTPTGGRFDGIFGVLAAFEALKTIKESGIKIKRSIQVVNWTNEEGSRFAPAMTGSGVYIGKLDITDVYGTKAADGAVFEKELERIGYKGAPVTGSPPHAYIEAHIEQGPVLESKDIPIGIVTGVQGQISLDVYVTGTESHSGSTPMDARSDALLASSKMVAAVNEKAVKKGNRAVATVGQLQVYPNVRNTVPGSVSFAVDIRVPDNKLLLNIESELADDFKEIAAGAGVTVSIVRLWHTPPVVFHKKCIEAVKNSAGELGYRSMELVSGAGHDACHISGMAPSGMIFIPCEKGISHNEAENAKPEDVAAGANVLLHSLLKLAE